ncbi:hypothetical protein NVP1170O_198 [Vibrio phage 1.170.O._10N.261.52.C3]|nr:hypothetical protein NVP1170O_198 [Vibrio phage 1.170.O._10N.261.52.C3]
MDTLTQKLQLIDELSKAFQRIRSCTNGDGSTQESEASLNTILKKLDEVVVSIKEVD